MFSWIAPVLTAVVLVPGTWGGQHCKQYDHHRSHHFTTYYCTGRCCGSLYDDDCCDGEKSISPSTIVGIVIACIILAVVLIGITICVVKSCKKSGAKGRMVQQPVFYTNSGHQPPPAFQAWPGNGSKQYPNFAFGPEYSASGPSNQLNGSAYPSGSNAIPEHPSSPPPSYDAPPVVHPDPSPIPEATPAQRGNALPPLTTGN